MLKYFGLRKTIANVVQHAARLFVS